MSGSDVSFVSSKCVSLPSRMPCNLVFTPNELSERNCCEQAFSNVVLWGGGEGSIVPWWGLSPSWDYASGLNTTSVSQFVFLPPPLGGLGWLKWAGVEYLPSYSTGQGLVNWFPLRAGLVKNRVFWNISKWLLFFSSCWSQRGFFWDIYCGNLIKLLEVSLIVLWGDSYDWGPL